VLTVQPRFVRFRMLNGAVSRALQLNFQDAQGTRYNDRCRIVGADGGAIGKDRTGPLGGRAFPTTHGLFMSDAYRWDVVCDFRGLDGSLFLTNEPNEKLMKPVPPMFCNSHLLMRIDITTGAAPSTSLFPAAVDLSPAAFNSPAAMADYKQVPENGTVVDQEMGPAAIADATQKALNGYWDRQMHFKKQGDFWVINNLGWGENINKHPRAAVADAAQSARDAEFGSHLIAPNVGQNFVEIWQLKAGGGWVHPVHVHLIQWCDAWSPQPVALPSCASCLRDLRCKLAKAQVS
jgi:FtsP/CotA-like multicopper oxidase with cupredoxin domain